MDSYIKLESDSKVSKIESFAFSYCDSLRAIIIPNSVEDIPSYCASNSQSLEYLKFPENLKKISNGAFNNCKNLATIECAVKDIKNVMVEQTSLGDFPFEGIKSDCLWIVPEGTSEAYKACPWWVNTWRIKEVATPDGITPICDNGAEIRIESGSVTITVPSNTTMRIYNINGHLTAVAKCVANIPTRVELPAGLYIINGRKFVINK